MKIGIVPSSELTTEDLRASHYLGIDRASIETATVRLKGKAAIWLRKESARKGQSMSSMVQQLVELAIERS